MGLGTDAFQLHRIRRVDSRLSAYAMNW